MSELGNMHKIDTQPICLKPIRKMAVRPAKPKKLSCTTCNPVLPSVVSSKPRTRSLDRLQYTSKENVVGWINKGGIVGDEKRRYTHSLLTLENNLSQLENVTVKSLLIELWIDLAAQVDNNVSFEEHRNTVHCITRVVSKCQHEKLETAFQVKKVLKEKNIPCNGSSVWLVRRHLEELNLKQENLPERIQSKSDIELYVQWIYDVDLICHEVEMRPELNHLRKMLPNLRKLSQLQTTQLEKLDVELRWHHTRIKQQVYSRGDDGVVYSPSTLHIDRNEDAFKHDEDITVVADGLGSCVHSDSMARLVVTHLHSRMKTVLNDNRGESIVPATVYQEILEAYRDVSKIVTKKLGNIETGAAVAMELRIPDDRGDVHRFLVFVGDCNAVLKRDSKQILINPKGYASFKDNWPPATTVITCAETGSLVPCLTVKDIDKLSENESATVRDVCDVGGYFSTCPNQTLFASGCMAMVYVKPDEGSTALMSDGVADRIRPENITPNTLRQIMVTESQIRQYSRSEQCEIDRFRYKKTLNELLAYRWDRVRLDPVLRRFKEKAQKRVQTEDGEKRMREDVEKLLKTLQWPETDVLIDGMTALFWYQYGGKVNGECQSVIPFETLDKVKNNMVQRILLEQFNLSKSGYADPMKWTDDLTYVDTDSPPCQTSDLDSGSIHALMTDLITLDVSNEQGLVDRDVADKLRPIASEYKRGEYLIQTKAKQSDKGRTRAYIRSNLSDISNGKMRAALSRIRCGQGDISLQSFLKHIEAR